MGSIIFKGPARYAKYQHQKKQGKPRRATAYSIRNEVLKKIGFMSYAEYLESQLWKVIREAKLAVDPGCEICGVPAQAIHHISYKYSALVGKNRRALVSICNDCHNKIEFTEGGKKRGFKRGLKIARRLLLASGRWAIHTVKREKAEAKQIKDDSPLASPSPGNDISPPRPGT